MKIIYPACRGHLCYLVLILVRPLATISFQEVFYVFTQPGSLAVSRQAGCHVSIPISKNTPYELKIRMQPYGMGSQGHVLCIVTDADLLSIRPWTFGLPSHSSPRVTCCIARSRQGTESVRLAC
jgi:hypothetical protein